MAASGVLNLLLHPARKRRSECVWKRGQRPCHREQGMWPPSWPHQVWL